MENFWDVLKRRFHIHHVWSKKHLPRYVDEVVGHHNQRAMDDRTRMAVIWQGMIGWSKVLRWKDLVAGPPGWPRFVPRVTFTVVQAA